MGGKHILDQFFIFYFLVQIFTSKKFSFILFDNSIITTIGMGYLNPNSPHNGEHAISLSYKALGKSSFY
jgi:hypothetical protein